jgi:hypothetical protein
MSDTHQSCFADISPSPAYLFRDYFYCEHCALETGKTTSPLHSYDAQKVNPIGPINRVITDFPTHCASETFCLKAITLPNGSRIGCPLKVELTGEGLQGTATFIASHILYGSRVQKSISRLWLKLCIDDFGSPRLALLSKSTPKRISSNPHVKKLTASGAKLAPQIYTDLFALYGGATSPTATLLWRIGISDDGKLEQLLTVSLPPSEANERSMSEMLEEAIHEGAWA